MRTLESLTIHNFKSIRHQTIKLRPLTAFIGANGAGKSNLVSVFPFVRRLVQRELQLYTGVSGGANRILHFGRKQSRSIGMELVFGEMDILKGYRFTLIPTDEDRFVFSEEAYWAHEREQYTATPPVNSLGTGHVESKLAMCEGDIVKNVLSDLLSYQLYHFHDTSSAAGLRQTSEISDNKVLRTNGSNLAAFLYLLKKTHPDHLRTIEETVRQVAPFFGGFELQPTPESKTHIRLEWRHRGSDDSWPASSLSDGTLRFICLCTLLLQPQLPAVVVLDEPELGLHPAALVILTGLLKSASTRGQVLLATQSVTILNQLTPEHVTVVEREDEATTLRPLSEMDQTTWKEGFSLGELWEMNVFGGRP